MSELQDKLAEASEKAIKQKKERRARVIKGSNLTEQLVALAKGAGLEVRENTGFFVFSGPAGKNVRIAVAKRGGIVDLLSFSVDSPAVRQVSKEEAEAKHLGRVQGRITFDAPDDVTLAAFAQAVTVLNVPSTEPVKTPRVPRVPKAVTPAAPEALALG